MALIYVVEVAMKESFPSLTMPPHILFNLSRRVIRISVEKNPTEYLKGYLGANLKQPNYLKFKEMPRIAGYNLQCLAVSLSTDADPQLREGQRLFPMRQGEDSILVDIWNSTIRSALPGILKPTIGENYTAGLLRKGSSEQDCVAVIQINVPNMPSRAVSEKIRSQIINLISEISSQARVKVEITTGSLTLLAGYDIEDQESLQYQEPPYPFYQRYWQRPGMGASIGLQCSKMVSATLGCYVQVDDNYYLLTVKHFIDSSYVHHTNGMNDTSSLSSPAPLEVDEMRTGLDQIIRSAESEIGFKYATDISPGDLLSVPDDVLNLLMIIQIAREDREPLKEGTDRLRLGQIYKTSEPVESSLTDIPLSDRETASGNAKYMDWALCRVVQGREGANRHRYKYDPETEETDFYSEESNSFGAGELCQETCPVIYNDKVHFVGQTTGRIRGEVNAAKFFVSQHGRQTEEYALVPTLEDQQANKSYLGASGASILRDSDNKMVGHLYGRTGGILLFSSIIEVFNDIKNTVGASVVRLAPDEWWMDTPESTNTSLIESNNEFSLICRIKEKVTPPRYSLKNMPLPKKMLPKAMTIPHGMLFLPKLHWLQLSLTHREKFASIIRCHLYQK